MWEGKKSAPHPKAPKLHHSKGDKGRYKKTIKRKKITCNLKRAEYNEKKLTDQSVGYYKREPDGSPQTSRIHQKKEREKCFQSIA